MIYVVIMPLSWVSRSYKTPLLRMLCGKLWLSLAQYYISRVIWRTNSTDISVPFTDHFEPLA